MTGISSPRSRLGFQKLTSFNAQKSPPGDQGGLYSHSRGFKELLTRAQDTGYGGSVFGHFQGPGNGT